MNEKGRIALSSLAVSVSVAALIGAAEVQADPLPPGVCNIGTACSLGWTPDMVSWSVPTKIVWDAEEGWHYDSTSMEAGGPVAASTGHWDYGTCGFNSSSPPACGCGGFINTDYYSATPWFSDYDFVPGYGDPSNEGGGYSPGSYVLNFQFSPPDGGVDLSYTDTTSSYMFFPVGTGPTGSYECWTET